MPSADPSTRYRLTPVPLFAVTIKVFATSPSATAIFVPDKVPPVKEQLMLASVGEVLVSL